MSNPEWNRPIRKDSNIPLPKRKHGELTDLLRGMNVGDSVLLEYGRAKSLRAIGYRLGLKMVLRDHGDGLARVWRMR